MSKHSAKGKRHAWRYVLLAVGVVLAVTVMAGAWIAYTGLQARDALVTAAEAVSGTQNALLGSDVAAAEASLTQASGLTAEAEAKTSDIVWKAVGALPVVGATPKAVTVTTEAANQVISESLPQFVQAAAILDVETIKNAEGKVDLARLLPASQALPALRRAWSRRRRRWRRCRPRVWPRRYRRALRNSRRRWTRP